MGDAPQSLSADEVRKVAKLARLALSDEDVERQRGDLAAVLGYVQGLRALELDDVEPMAHVGDQTNRLRDDTPGETLDNAVAMDLAPDALPPFISVPKVLDDGGGA